MPLWIQVAVHLGYNLGGKVSSWVVLGSIGCYHFWANKTQQVFLEEVGKRAPLPENLKKTNLQSFLGSFFHRDRNKKHEPILSQMVKSKGRNPLIWRDFSRLVKYDSIWAMCVSFAAGSRLPKILPPALQHTPLVLCPGGKVRDLPGEEIPRLPDRGNVARNNSVIPWRCR